MSIKVVCNDCGIEIYVPKYMALNFSFCPKCFNKKIKAQLEARKNTKEMNEEEKKFKGKKRKRNNTLTRYNEEKRLGIIE